MTAYTKYVIALLFLFCANTFAQDSKLVIVRHGEGEHNHLHIYSTWTKEEGGADHVLTEKGKQQVVKTARSLFDQGINQETVGLILVSPMQRTRETAQILIENGVGSEKVITIDDRIREPLAQDWEGFPTPPLNPNEDRWETVVNESALHGGETPEAIRKRMEKILDQLAQWDPANGHVILVTHGYPSRTLLQILGEKNILLDTAEARVLSLPSESN